jgi:hypothetical protein
LSECQLDSKLLKISKLHHFCCTRNNSPFVYSHDPGFNPNLPLEKMSFFSVITCSLSFHLSNNNFLTLQYSIKTVTSRVRVAQIGRGQLPVSEGKLPVVKISKNVFASRLPSKLKLYHQGESYSDEYKPLVAAIHRYLA